MPFPYAKLDRRARELSPEKLDTYLALQRELIARGEKEQEIRKALEQFLREHEQAAKK